MKLAAIQRILVIEGSHGAIRRPSEMRLRRAFLAGLLVLAQTPAIADSAACPSGRTALEMAGHTLCLLNTATPSIHRREDGSVQSLVWSHPERFLPEVQLPPGTFYLIVESETHIPSAQISPSLEDSEPSDLPQMRQTADSISPLSTRKWLHPVKERLNGQPFVLECSEAIVGARRFQGAHNCELISEFASGLWIEVHLATVNWANGSAWPQLDETWVETWPPYLSDLSSGLNNLLFIQQ